MSWIGAGIAGGALISAGASWLGSREAANAQGKAAQLGIEEQRRQFAELQKLMAPYQQSGLSALQAQQNLLGMGGVDAQRQAISALEQSPQFQSLVQQGEGAMLANASATGGLRGGNLQGALAQFRPQMLSQLIEQQYSRLGGIAGMGFNAASALGGGGMQMAGAIGDMYGQQGAAQAGAAMGKWGALGQIGSALPALGGLYASGYGFGRNPAAAGWSPTGQPGTWSRTRGYGGETF